MAKNTEKAQKNSLRPPIVSVLGHVDHGKTTLLDYIRKTSVAGKEAGGITQSIGASKVKTKEGKEVTFIDTPGHAAFASMRSRGAEAADIAILVVAADDGVKPQTKEALEHILSAKIPFVVAATKIDLSSSSADNVRNQLEKEGIAFEGRGGEIPLVEVSGKTGRGIDDLLEVITLVAQLHEVKASPDNNLEAVVIETGKDKRGPIVTVVVKNGKLTVGQQIISETVETKVRSLFDHNDKPIKVVYPGDPCLILGFSDLPEVGSRIWGKKEGEIISASGKPATKVKAKEGEIGVVIKADNAGSLEAVLDNLPENVFVIASGVGDVSESDIFMAKSGDALILAFNSNISSGVTKLAAEEGVEVETFGIIYELFEKLEKILEKDKVKIAGEAKIVATFPFDGKKVAGCKVMKGAISKNDKLILKRDDKQLGEAKISSMKKEKADVDEVKQGEECGIIISPQLDFKEEDMLISVRN